MKHALLILLFIAGWVATDYVRDWLRDVSPTTIVVGNCSAPTDTYEVVVSRTWMRSDGALVQQCQTHLDLYALHRDYTK